tara:strand:- start:785 stop:1261 length:477 start_codon:yes stop_codon:yes gene_type:complete
MKFSVSRSVPNELLAEHSFGSGEVALADILGEIPSTTLNRLEWFYSHTRTKPILCQAFTPEFELSFAVRIGMDSTLALVKAETGSCAEVSPCLLKDHMEMHPTIVFPTLTDCDDSGILTHESFALFIVHERALVGSRSIATMDVYTVPIPKDIVERVE